jgi:hypothetical protein
MTRFLVGKLPQHALGLEQGRQEIGARVRLG